LRGLVLSAAPDQIRCDQSIIRPIKLISVHPSSGETLRIDAHSLAINFDQGISADAAANMVTRTLLVRKTHHRNIHCNDQQLIRLAENPPAFRLKRRSHWGQEIRYLIDTFFRRVDRLRVRSRVAGRDSTGVGKSTEQWFFSR